MAEYWPNWAFGQKLRDYVHQPTPAHATAIQQLITDLDVMGVHEDARWYQKIFAHAKTGQVHHSETLIARKFSMPVVTSLGALIQQRRLYLGMQREDLDAYGSVSALRRFENDQTQLSFATLTQVMGQLALLPSQALTLINRDADHPNGMRNLRATFLQIALHPEIASQAITHFQLENAQQPSSILAKQLFVLRKHALLSHLGDVELAQERLTELFQHDLLYTL